MPKQPTIDGLFSCRDCHVVFADALARCEGCGEQVCTTCGGRHEFAPHLALCARCYTVHLEEIVRTQDGAIREVDRIARRIIGIREEPIPAFVPVGLAAEHRLSACIGAAKGMIDQFRFWGVTIEPEKKGTVAA